MECFAAAAIIISFFSPLFRSIWLRKRDFSLSSRPFWIFIILSLAANFLAFLAFHQLVLGPANPHEDYRGVIDILALLSAGAIAGFWGIDYGRACADETHLLNIISGLLVSVFYALFFSICFYIGKTDELQKAPIVSWVVPGIMALLLEINAVIDIWDYRKCPPTEKNCTAT